VAQKFHLAILRIKLTRASCGLSAIAELLVLTVFIMPQHSNVMQNTTLM